MSFFSNGPKASPSGLARYEQSSEQGGVNKDGGGKKYTPDGLRPTTKPFVNVTTSWIEYEENDFGERYGGTSRHMKESGRPTEKYKGPQGYQGKENKIDGV